MQIENIKSSERTPVEELDHTSALVMIYKEKMAALIARRKQLSAEENAHSEDPEVTAFLASLQIEDPRFQKVELRSNETGNYAITLEGHNVGFVRIKNNKDGMVNMPASLLESSSITFISLNKAVRGKRLGNPVYEKIFQILRKSGKQFISDPVRLSPSALRFWEKLAIEGVARHSEHYNPEGQPIYIYEGK